MAKTDYRCCDVCDHKVFYDAHLNYEQTYRDHVVPAEDIARIAGVSNPYGYKLDYLGDWAVICRDCAKTHKCVVLPLTT